MKLFQQEKEKEQEGNIPTKSETPENMITISKKQLGDMIAAEVSKRPLLSVEDIHQDSEAFENTDEAWKPSVWFSPSISKAKTIRVVLLPASSKIIDGTHYSTAETSIDIGRGGYQGRNAREEKILLRHTTIVGAILSSSKDRPITPKTLMQVSIAKDERIKQQAATIEAQNKDLAVLKRKIAANS